MKGPETFQSRQAFCPDEARRGLSDEDWKTFGRLTSVELTEADREMAASPGRVDPTATEFLATHWHPEWAPMDLIERRLKTAFPQARNFLAIPTQHNRVMTFGPWAGVEADVYDRRYDLKVQLLIHFRADRLERATAFGAMMDSTYNYRAHQLMDILSRLAEPGGPADLSFSLKETVSGEAIDMARFYAIRLAALIEDSGIYGTARGEMLKNRLLPDFMHARSDESAAALMDQALIYINAVKKSVKADLSPDAFFSPQEVIEEARALGAGIVIPHPPAFWPILLSGLDVDGWEVWNSSTPNHTVFLTEALARASSKRKLLAFMGDDTHMSAKMRPPTRDDKGSATREIGFQDPWTDPRAAKALAETGQSRTRTINEYRERLM